MMRMLAIKVLGLSCMLSGVMFFAGCDEKKTSDAPATNGEVSKEVKNDNIKNLPGLVIHQDKGILDLEAEVAMDQGTLELVACADQTKEHESIVSLKSKAQNVHFALILMGLKSGKPGAYKMEGNQLVTTAPEGDAVEVFLVIDGKETPIEEFVIGLDGKSTLGKSVFTFAGSRFSRSDTGVIEYEANNSGNIISLVAFGDDVLAWPEPASQANNELIWSVKPGMLPKPGTPVTLRVKKVIK